jgi:hypothetical protein
MLDKHKFITTPNLIIIIIIIIIIGKQMLRNIFGPKMHEIRGKFMISHKEQFCDLFNRLPPVIMVNSRRLW